MLHNISPSRILLCKMKVRDDYMCSYCNDVVDCIEHPSFDCLTIQKFWNYIEQYILITLDIQTHLTVADVLFRIKQHHWGKGKTKRINHIILMAKMCMCITFSISMYIMSVCLFSALSRRVGALQISIIIMSKKTNAFLPLSMIFENQLRLRYVYM